MGAYELHYRSCTPENSSPELSIIQGQAPERAFFEGSDPSNTPEVDITVWPQLQFEVSEQNIFGGTTLPTNPNNRLRSAVRTIQAVAPGLIEDVVPKGIANGKPKPPLAPAEACREYRKRLQTFFNDKITAGDAAVTKGQLLPEKELLRFYTKSYRATNHPVEQFMVEIAALNETRQDQNGVNTNQRKPTLSASDMDQLYDELIILCEGQHLLEAAKDQLDTKRTQLAAILAIQHTF
jgi:hypothetical protein